MANPLPEPQVIIPYKQLCELLQAGEEVKILRAEVKQYRKELDAMKVIQRECINKIGELTGILDIDELRDDTDEHLYVSRSRTWKVEYGSAGTTIYHGSPSSNMYIRIYDKAAEQAAKADDPNAFEDVHWIRVEMQMRDEIAKGFVDGLMSNTVGNQFRGVLHNYLRYVVPTEDQNMSRWDMAPYWAELLDGAGKIRCWSAPGVDYTIWNLSNYIVNQAGNALDCYLRIFGYDDLIRELGNRSVKMSPKYQRLLAKYERLKQKTEDPNDPPSEVKYE